MAEKNVDCTEMDADGWTLLHHICQDSRNKRMAPLLAEALVHTPPSYLDALSGNDGPFGGGWSAVGMVCSGNWRGGDRQVMLVELLKARASPNTRNTGSLATPLITAAGAGYKDAVGILLDYDVDVMAMNANKKNAWDAAPDHCSEIKKWLHQRGCKQTFGATGTSRLLRLLCVQQRIIMA